MHRTFTVIETNYSKSEEWYQVCQPPSSPTGPQQVKRGAEDGKGESGEEAAGGAESGASLLSTSN